MNSRDVWSHGGRRSDLIDLLSSAFLMLLITKNSKDKNWPVYLSSPWITDFQLCENGFLQFASLFPEIADKKQILFSDYLAELGKAREVRIITREDKYSKDFLAHENIKDTKNIEARFSDPEHHEKGILTPFFYIFGSMNLTYHGVTINGEKITYYAAGTEYGNEKIGHTYIEFDRLWENIQRK